ncbi:nicotinamide riboside transporter PnuC [Pedobacter endophyticus]|uniref:Nicotinamide riboside transporter PnuC n=1 Tax=Pedobacter endophyticus TaxID=2789740 RepID=A0A7U3Q3A7_9SPHI|nr:nicotinamide riboside transporter PnuC [Pedobacter endophyticus]QPH37765.1 nicotinamide mononucleotide transporter [Pedobacter endophyticus]
MVVLKASFFEFLLEQAHQTSLLEWVAVVAGFLCIYLAAKESIWNWPISIISVVAYGFLFFREAMYGDMTLQIYFLFTAFYGWYFWIRKKVEHSKPISRLSPKHWLLVIIFILALSILLGWFMDNYTNSTVPYADGFCTSVSFVAQFLLTRKILENWLLWVFVNICYVPLFIYKNLNLSALLYIVLIAIAFKGYLDWKKTYREQIS